MIQNLVAAENNVTGVGIGILFITAVLMLRNIERALNNIWRNSEKGIAHHVFVDARRFDGEFNARLRQQPAPYLGA